MLIQQKLGNISSFDLNGKRVDLLRLEWYETDKRILHKRTERGGEVILKFMKEPPGLLQGDVLYEDSDSLILVDILPCTVMAIQPRSLFELGSVCYEIGNKHLPLFYEGNELLLPFDAPLFRLLQGAGYTLTTDERKLVNRMKTSVAAHKHSAGESLFSKIIKRTTPLSHVRP